MPSAYLHLSMVIARYVLVVACVASNFLSLHQMRALRAKHMREKKEFKIFKCAVLFLNADLYFLTNQ